MSIGFIQKALHYEDTPIFAKVKGQFVTLKYQRSAEKKVLHFHLKGPRFHLRKLLEEHLTSTETIRNILKSTLFKIICFKLLTEANYLPAKKKQKLHNLIIKFNKLPKDKYNIPVSNLSSES